MFNAPALKAHLENAYTVRSQTRVVAEYNMNIPGSIEKIGVYRYRPFETRYKALPAAYDPFDVGDFYTDANNSYLEVVYDDETYRQDYDIMRRTFSLRDCFSQQRPRSGINKLMYFGNRTISPASNSPVPRYYPANADDPFKYWSSYKKEGAQERGVSYKRNNAFPIDDAVPFVVYKQEIEVNRIVVKMQTHSSATYGTPRTPAAWSVQGLINDSWQTLWTGTDADVPSDGHVEIGYGIVSPVEGRFVLLGTVANADMLPEKSTVGDAWIVKPDEDAEGMLYVRQNGWETHALRRSWTLIDPDLGLGTHMLTSLLKTPHTGPTVTLRGLRIIVNAMRTDDTPFDLIELSPRLAVEMTDRTVSFDVEKTLGDMSGSMPVGDLQASTGSIEFDNSDNGFASLAGYDNRIKISIYEQIMGVEGYDYTVPIKTLYSETKTNVVQPFENVSLELRDLYFLFEGIAAPDIFMTDVSLSRAILTLMDYIGFSNVAFRRNGPDPVIPFFFCSSEKNVAEVLVDLAQATQSAMHFDEYNNFVVVMKEALLPDKPVAQHVMRTSDGDGLANIESIASADRPVFNAGEIAYTKRHIQRTYASLGQAMYHSMDKTWVYAPQLLWEAEGVDTMRPSNEPLGKSSSHTLSAMPLARPLTAALPVVANGRVENNVINVGDAANYASRYQGYVYANGEIIRYDAVEYAVTNVGNVWVESPDEYQNLLLNLTFGGRIYPTGLLRIFAEPYFNGDNLVPGPVKRHGRGQFNTTITTHEAGLNVSWADNANVHGMFQSSEFLFDMREETQYPSGMVQNAVAGTRRRGVLADPIAKGSTRNGIMKNNLSQKFWSDDAVRRMTNAQIGTMQSSALIFAGGSFPLEANQREHVSYVSKSLDKPFTSFGTRCRIVGQLETGGMQNPVGATPYYTIPNVDPSKQQSVSGGSGGIGININDQTNNGYFFEVAALTNPDPSSYDVQDRDIEANLGKIVNASLKDGVASITVDKKSLTVVPSLSVYDMVSISGISNGPNINGAYNLQSITNEGTVLTYNVPVVPYTWLTAFGTVNNPSNGVSLGTPIEASVSSENKFIVTFAAPTGVSLAEPYDAKNWLVSDSIPNVNKRIKVIGVSPDTRVVTFDVPRDSYTYAAADLERAEAKKLTSQSVKLTNVWFYKTVADNLGGRILSYSRTGTYTKVTVDKHRLSKNDFVTISVSPLAGQYQVTNVIGNDIFLNRGGTTISGNISPSTVNTIGLTDPVATPYKLWSGLTNILVDTGQFWGQYRTMGDENPTVYDLNVEYVDSAYGRTFYLYINNRQIATVIDTNPLPKTNQMALFVRGSTKMMFENVYALGENIANGSVANQVSPGEVSSVFGIDSLTRSDIMHKYAMSGMIQSSFLTGVSSKGNPNYNIFYDEFGTIMRECEYFNIRYDKAYPALYAQLAATPNINQGYAVSGFNANAYGAEFMVFNCTDNLLSLDADTGNYLRINGVVFTQDISKTLSVDDYLGAGVRDTDHNPDYAKSTYDNIMASRQKHGKHEFRIESPYIQSDAAANDLMRWTISKISKPRLNVGMEIFANPVMQLGDIVEFDDRPGKFVIYNMSYHKDTNDTTQTIYVTEI